MSFEKFSYVGILPIPQLIYTNLAQNYLIYLGPLAWICIPFKTRIFIENRERCKPIKTWLHIIKKNEIFILRTLNELFLKHNTVLKRSL